MPHHRNGIGRQVQAGAGPCVNVPKTAGEKRARWPLQIAASAATHAAAAATASTTTIASAVVAAAAVAERILTSHPD